MQFVFSRRFYVLMALGFLPLSLSWNLPALQYAVLGYDLLLLIAALADHFTSRRISSRLTLRREFDRRFAIGDPTKVSVFIDNSTRRDLWLRIKDEYPAEMALVESREAEFSVEAFTIAEFYYHL